MPVYPSDIGGSRASLALMAAEELGVDYNKVRPIVADTVNLGGRFAIETRGTWRMTGDLMGGPFVSYAFYDEDQGRFYLIDGMVYAPNDAKREFLRRFNDVVLEPRVLFRPGVGCAEAVVGIVVADFFGAQEGLGFLILPKASHPASGNNTQHHHTISTI